MKWLWIGVAALFAVAAAAVFIAFQRPDFVAGLMAAAVSAAVKAAWPGLKIVFAPSKLTPAERREIELTIKWHRGGGKNG